jgi:hypothetical protein
MQCYLKCRFHFHVSCWKEYKGRCSQAEKLVDKDMLDRLCPTPDCHSFIAYIVIDRPGKKLVGHLLVCVP